MKKIIGGVFKGVHNFYSSLIKKQNNQGVLFSPSAPIVCIN